jgi:predicted TIM-barrel fold metal-dependent hydrolase
MATKRIDVHHHVIPAVYLEAMARAKLADPIAGVAYPTWNVEEDLAVMDRQGIQTSIVSITAPGIAFTRGVEAAQVARETNAFLAELIAEHPDRYGAFALLPLPDVDAALKEIDYALDVLKLDGIALFTNHNGVYLGDPVFDPIFARLAESEVIVHVHPAVPPAADQPGFGLPPSLYEFVFDTTRAVANLLYSGTLDRHPGLRLILSHAGGAVPYIARRLTYASTINPALSDRTPLDPLASIRDLYYDTAMSANPHALAALTSLIPTEHILFGSDYPFMPESTTRETVAGLDAHFEPDRLRLVERENALRFFPRLARASSDAGVRHGG